MSASHQLAQVNIARLAAPLGSEQLADFVAAYTACWWVPTGHIPTTAEAESRLSPLREHGPTPEALTLRQDFPAPAIRSPSERLSQ